MNPYPALTLKRPPANPALVTGHGKKWVEADEKTRWQTLS